MIRIAKPSSNKLHAQKCYLDGARFDSRAEMQRYIQLKAMQDRGEISGLQRQVRYRLTNAHRRKWDGRCERAAEYIADFVYTQNGETIVEDVKGCTKGATYSTFVLKRKLMFEKYGIEVHEIHM